VHREIREWLRGLLEFPHRGLRLRDQVVREFPLLELFLVLRGQFRGHQALFRELPELSPGLWPHSNLMRRDRLRLREQPDYSRRLAFPMVVQRSQSSLAGRFQVQWLQRSLEFLVARLEAVSQERNFLSMPRRLQDHTIFPARRRLRAHLAAARRRNREHRRLHWARRRLPAYQRELLARQSVEQFPALPTHRAFPPVRTWRLRRQGLQRLAGCWPAVGRQSLRKSIRRVPRARRMKSKPRHCEAEAFDQIGD
jgi:hypothetical protein